jgi:FtsP/CotA-like multicopper oxidase with cupredoxin domain
LLYLIVAAIGHFVWEAAQLPLYTIWWTGTARENFIAVVHCTGGDVLITTATLLTAGILARLRGWHPFGSDTTVHWHGIRLPNAMDGVPGFTQPPIRPGESFTYELTPPDAGTFWYHPHADTLQQLGRGLAEPIVDHHPDPITLKDAEFRAGTS